MLRGCFLVIKQGWSSKFGSTFTRLSNEGQIEFIEERLLGLPLVNAEFVAEARESLQKITHLCDGPVVRDVHQNMCETVEALSISSREG